MKLAWAAEGRTGARTRAILLFGIGLIGRCISQSLVRGGRVVFEDLPLDWNDGDMRRAQLQAARGRISKHADEREIVGIDTVWTAGKAGFGATADQLALEDKPFDDVLDLARDLAGEFPGARHHFHMMSSAGGLFEGQRLVSNDTPADPLRPYGQAKLAQENRASRPSLGLVCSIYRPSSVYGYNRLGGRAGLITVLVDNANMHRTSHIYGDINTLRDYVLASDIGDFVAGRVLSADAESGSFLLANGKPAAIGEVLRIVEKTAGRRLYVRFERQPSNADHMSFAPSALPANWMPTDLETGIRLTTGQLLGSVKVA